MKKTNLTRLASIAFFIALIAIFLLRSKGAIGDHVAVPGALVSAIGLIVSATLFGISVYKNKS